jgi:DNA-binding XRE family transcriptional regulator
MSFTLKQARLVNEKSQAEMADMLGVHVNTYRHLEEKPDDVTISQAKKISEFLKIPYNDIFFAD